MTWIASTVLFVAAICLFLLPPNPIRGYIGMALSFSVFLILLVCEDDKSTV